MREGSTASFAIAANGLADGPAQALRDYLVAQGARVTTIWHPLGPHEGTRHVVATYEDDARVSERGVDLRLRPPFSYVFDPLVPLRAPRAEIWFGFNPLACARGLLARRLGRVRRTVLWSVDFTPDRFGAGMTTRAYDRLDRFCCMHADARVELSEAARDARNARHGLETPAHIVPMGTWLDRVPSTAPEPRRRVVFLGELVRGKGVELLLDAVTPLDVRVDIVGGGPLEPWVREEVAHRALGERVDVHGFVADHRDVERIVAQASLALAPYTPEPGSHTRWADPGKLKVYLAAGLPIVMTDVPPNAAELARAAGAELVAADADAIRAAIERGLSSPEAWRARREAALAYARRFDWNVLLAGLMRDLA